MNCSYCKGVETVDEQVTTFCAYDVADPFLVESVPAFVCRVCGEKSFSVDTVNVLSKVHAGLAKPTDCKMFQLFDFQKLRDLVDIEPGPADIR